MTSKLEAALANDLHLMSRKSDAPWPEAVREMHPMWCCEHKKAAHDPMKHKPPAYVHVPPCCFGCMYEPAGNHTRMLFAHTFVHERDFRVDFAWPKHRVICEVEGVNWGVQGGRHQTGAGFSKDLEKYAALELAGWRVIRCGAAQIKDGTALGLIEAALGVRNERPIRRDGDRDGAPRCAVRRTYLALSERSPRGRVL